MGSTVCGVYSMGGGNAGIAAALVAAGVAPVPFVGHDLDADNLALLRTGVLTAVLHHDLRADLRAALTQLLRAHRLLPGAPTSVPSAPQVVTPWNVPTAPAPLTPAPGSAEEEGGGGDGGGRGGRRRRRCAG